MEENNTINTDLSDNTIPTGLPGGFFVYDADNEQRILFAEQNVIELFGCQDIVEFRKFTGNSFKGMVHPDDYQKIDAEILSQTFNSEKIHDYVRYRILTKNQEVRYVEDFGHLLHGKDGRRYFYVYIVDLDKDEYYNSDRNSFAESQLKEAKRNFDRLTGLLNMSAFYEMAQKKIAENDKLTFIHFDIINFKMFNEQNGFRNGDDLLIRTAFLIRNEFPGSLIARFSDDHFVVCTEDEDVIRKVENVHMTLLKLIEGTRVVIKAGIAHLDDECHEVSLACDHARIACNLIKRRHDRIYEVYASDIHYKLQRQQYILDNIDKAVENDYLKVYYQPIIRTKNGKICGYEALARWEDPVYGMLPPKEFITVLEEYHLIHKADIYIIRQVCEDLHDLMVNNEPVVPVSINLSRLDFELCDIFAVVEENVSRFGLDRGLLDIEITESAINDDSQFMIERIRKFHDAGYRIWIDDFGSGYSSLNHLLDYPFDTLKLDLEFLRNLDRNNKEAELISTVVNLAHALESEPLQEGVETAEHFEFLKKIGCEKAQGYYFAKPLPMAESKIYTRSKGLEWES